MHKTTKIILKLSIIIDIVSLNGPNMSLNCLLESLVLVHHNM